MPALARSLCISGTVESFTLARVVHRQVYEKAVIAPEELLGRATALAKLEGNIEIMDRTAILHGYLELTRLDPNNTTYRKNVEDAAARLLQAARTVIGALD